MRLFDKGGIFIQSKRIHRMTELALLFALTVVLMVVEGMIPPIPTLPPGVKLGLSNIAVMYTLFYLGKGSAVTLLTLKSLFVFLTRGVTAFLMSFAGGIVSICVMILLILLKKQNISFIMLSVWAAVAHNMAQLVVSAFLLSSTATFGYAPVLAVSGIVMGIVTGTILKVMMPVMQRLSISNHAK